MNSVRTEIAALNHKVDALYQMVEQLCLKVPDCTGERESTPASYSLESARHRSVDRLPNGMQMGLDASFMQHKDILDDEDRLEGDRQNTDKELTPDLQVQRLTAQLTAAYNRIAALEERLLSQRVQ